MDSQILLTDVRGVKSVVVNVQRIIGQLPLIIGGPGCLRGKAAFWPVGLIESEVEPVRDRSNSDCMG